MAAGLQPVFKHQARDTGEFSGVVRHKDTARSPGDRGDPEVGLADDGTCLFESAANVNIVFHCRDVRPGNGERLEDMVHLKRVMIRSGTFRSSKFQLCEHLERNENFTGRMLEKPLPQMVGTAAKAGDKDVGIDETGHLRLGIEGFHGGREWPAWSLERRVINGAEGRHPLSGVGG